MAYNPEAWQSKMGADSRALAQADFDERGQAVQGDHAAHKAGKTCADCGEVIRSFQDARRVGEAEWIHDGCHRPGRPTESTR